MSREQPFLLKFLKNGLRVVVAPNKSTQAVTVMVMYRVGSRDEPRSIAGAAHFIEHLMFKGSKKYPRAIDVSRILDGLGAEYNAFTGKDTTGYYVKVAREKLEQAIEILSDILINPRLAAPEIERERGVIIEEINMYQDNPRSIAGELADSLIFKGHPLAREVVGTKQVISSISRNQLLKFKNQYYTTGNAVVSIAGNVKEQETVKMCNKYFKIHNSRQTTNNNNLFKNKQSEPRVALKTKSTEQVHLSLGLSALADSDPRLPVLKLMAVILGGGMSSRLFVELREKRGLCYYISAPIGIYAETGELAVRAGLDRRRLPEAIQLILGELKKLKSRPVSAAELARAKDQVRGMTALAQEDSDFVADFYAKEILYREKVLTPTQKLAQLNRVTASQIRGLARELLVTKRLNLAIVSHLNKNKEDEFKKLLKL